METMTIKNAAQDTNLVTQASSIMTEVARWLIEIHKPMWKEEMLSAQQLIATYDLSEIYVAYINENPCATFVLQWRDEDLWPNHVNDEAGYVHKLCVKRAFKGQGLSHQILDWCKAECKKHGKSYLRIDCDANRQGLVDLYEDNDFKFVERRFVGPYDLAFFEYKIPE